MPHITSTLTAPQEYAEWTEQPGGGLKIIKSVIVQGGANVANKHFVTPQGVVTEVTDEQADFLKNHVGFKEHQERGFVKIHRTEKMDVKGLEAGDASKPATPDLIEDLGLKPSTVTE